ncbi:MAG: nucleotide-binding domain containing protein [Alphaproteobacteria bacterium]
MARRLTEPIDRHPTMSVHPVTPMAEADLRRHLAAQGLDGVAVLRAVPLHRVGTAGGDTSSLAVRAFGCWGLSYRCKPAPGVTVSRTHADDPAADGLELMLKGSRMGGDDLFERLLG